MTNAQNIVWLVDLDRVVLKNLEGIKQETKGKNRDGKQRSF